MASFEAVSCEICLRPYPANNLFYVAIESDVQGQGRLAVFCKSCATAIAKALRATHELAPVEEASHES